jgi:signal peptidase II
MSARKKSLFFIAVILLVLIIDQCLKLWVKSHMYLGQNIEVTSWFNIFFIENNGMAFGMEIFGKLFLSLFRIVAIIAIIIFSVKLIKSDYRLGYIICIGLILAGAIGNLIDSAFYGMMFNSSEGNTAVLVLFDQPEGATGYSSFLHGKVVDMLYFPIIKNAQGETLFFSPVFNIADSAVTIGVFAILLFFRKDLNSSLESKPKKEIETVHEK